MKIVDFDNEFRHYIENWIMENADNYGDHAEMESGMINVYAKWLNTPADFIDGVCPIDYFKDMNNPDELTELLIKYKKKGVTIPDLLLDKISELDSTAGKALAKLVTDDLDMSDDDSNEIKMIAINLLSEMNDSFMHDMYVDMLSNAKLDNELANLMIEKLEYGDKKIVDRIFDILNDNDENIVRERYADVLVHYRNDDRVFDFLISMFNDVSNNTSLYAAYLGKYDNDRAVDILTEALDWQGISYIDYMEIRASLERFGEEVNHKRDFSGDNYFEALKNIEQ